jgi:hypothetical protein
MSHNEEPREILSHEEIMYRYHIQRGSDFTKIDLFRSARENYKKSLEYKPGDPFALEKAAECNAFIKRDKRKVFIIVPIVLLVIAAVIIFA